MAKANSLPPDLAPALTSSPLVGSPRDRFQTTRSQPLYLSDRDHSRASRTSSSPQEPRWPLRRGRPQSCTPALESLPVGKQSHTPDQTLKELASGKDLANGLLVDNARPYMGPAVAQDREHSRTSLEEIPQELSQSIGSNDRPRSAQDFAPNEKRGTDHTEMKTVEIALDRLTAAAETNSRNLLTLKAEMLDLHQSNAVNMVEEPSWVRALKWDMQAMLRKELSEMFEKSKEMSTAAQRYQSADVSHSHPLESKFGTNTHTHGNAIQAGHHAHHQKSKNFLRHNSDNFDSNGPKKSVDANHWARLDTDIIKERIRAEAFKNHYDVKEHYRESGIFPRIAKNQAFEYVTLAVIVVNAIWMAVVTDGSDATSLVGAKPQFVVADVLFYIYFSGELFVRFVAFRHKVDCLRDWWFVFDSALVVLYTLDPFVLTLLKALVGAEMTWPNSVLRLIRLARLSRLTRILKNFQELVIMIKGMLTALATVGYTSFFLTLVTYVFAIALRNVVPENSEIEELFFPNVLQAMHHLFLHGTFMDNLSWFILLIQNDSAACLIIAWCYVAISALLIMNMLIGIMCEVISAVAAEEKEILMVARVKDAFSILLERYDFDNDGLLSYEEFASLVACKDCQRALKMVDVDPQALVDMAEEIFVDDSGTHEVSFEKFIGTVLESRGSNAASVKDVMTVSRRMSAKMMELKHLLEQLAAVEETKLNSEVDSQSYLGERKRSKTSVMSTSG